MHCHAIRQTWFYISQLKEALVIRDCRVSVAGSRTLHGYPGGHYWVAVRIDYGSCNAAELSFCIRYVLSSYWGRQRGYKSSEQE